MIQVLEPAAIDAFATPGFQALAAAELYTLGFPLAHYPSKQADGTYPAGSGAREPADFFELFGYLVGEDVGAAINATLNVYRCPEGDLTKRAIEAFAALTLDNTTKGTAPGADLVTNGTFAADANWTKGPGWSIAAGQAVHAASGHISEISQSVAAVEDSIHLLQLKPTLGASEWVNVFVGDQFVVKIDGPNTAAVQHVFTRTGAGTGDLRIQASPDSMQLDDVILQVVTPFNFGYVGKATDFGSGVAFGLLPAASMAGTFLRLWFRRFRQMN